MERGAARPGPESAPYGAGWPRWAALVGAALLLGVAAAAAATAVRLAVWPYPNENFEGGCVLAARLWAHGRPLYWRPSDGGAPIYNYPPLYATAIRALDSHARPFLAGRLIGLAALLSAAAAIALALRKTGTGTSAVLAAALAVAIPTSVRYAAAVRVDALASFLSLATLVVVWLSPANRRALAAAALLGVAAWLTKQTAVLGPAAALLWLLGVDRRGAALFAAVYAGVLGAAFLALEAATGGAFARNVFTYSMTPFSWDRLAAFLAQQVLTDEPLNGLALVGIVAGLGASRRQGWRSSPLPAYLLLNLAALLWLGKAGSSRLYFFEFGLAGALGLGWGLATLERGSPRAGAMATLAIGLLAVGGLPSATTAQLEGRNAPTEDRVTAAVRQARGPLMLEDPGYAALANRLDAELVNPFLANQLFARGLADPAPVLAAVRDGRFGLIALASPATHPSPTTRDRYAPALLTAIADSYELLDAFGETYLYIPRQSAARE